MKTEIAKDIQSKLALEAHEIVHLIFKINLRLEDMLNIIETKPVDTPNADGDTYRIYPDGELYHEDSFDEIEGERAQWYYDEVTILNMPNLETEDDVYNFVHRAIINEQRSDK